MWAKLGSKKELLLLFAEKTCINACFFKKRAFCVENRLKKPAIFFILVTIQQSYSNRLFPEGKIGE